MLDTIPELAKMMLMDEEEKQALDFLGRDFNQCFQQMRHYDSQIVNIFKFMFTAYAGLIGVSAGLYEFSIRAGKDLTLAALLALGVGFILGLFFFALIIRNRLYFVNVTRYINEQRNLFLALKPMGFQNISDIYTDPTKPPFFSAGSTEAWFMYIIAFMNALLLIGFTLVLTFRISGKPIVIWIILAFVLSFGLQLLAGIIYLISREGKSIVRRTWGKEKQSK